MSGWRQSKGQGSEQLGRVSLERARLNCNWNEGKGPAIRSKCEVREELHRSWQVWRGGKGIREREDSVCVWKIETGFPSGLGAFGLWLSRTRCLLECGRPEEVVGYQEHLFSGPLPSVHPFSWLLPVHTRLH